MVPGHRVRDGGSAGLGADVHQAVGMINRVKARDGDLGAAIA
jgi:hypothetical protein